MTHHHPNVRDIVEMDGQFYILATSAIADDRDLVLACGDTFAVLDRVGDVTPIGLHEQGLYHEGTRYLSTLLLRLGVRRFLLLSSSVKADNALAAVDLTNPDVFDEGRLALPRGLLHLARTTVLWDHTCCIRLTASNYGQAPIAMPIVLSFDADFADIFEVRGVRRVRRGVRLPPEVTRSQIVLGYRGLDDVVRETRVTIEPAASECLPESARIDLSLEPGAEACWDITLACERRGADRSRVGFVGALDSRSDELRTRRSEFCDIITSNQEFNGWLEQSVADLSMISAATPEGPFPYAGVPWFSTPFGRDALLTAFECLWANPTMARAVLRYLADTQALVDDPDQDAQPGKILHEARGGEMANLGEVPFGRYYGSHDATPLFVMLAAAYYETTGDRAFVDSLEPHIDRALAWIERDGDPDRDGFLEYARHSPDGLVHQGWKDSHDAVFHDDGRAADAPIAICEVQAYAYAAWRGAAALAQVRGDLPRAAALLARADAMRDRFDAAFWWEEAGTYALALDGQKQPCRVRSSNAGHVLFAGLAKTERAPLVARALRGADSFSGWGVRTLSTHERRYNPMSYHNGSVWPHDNALIAYGLAKYGQSNDALAILTGLFDASLHVGLHRLPELFCGFRRRAGESPTLYPVACSPQAWAAGSVFLLLQAALGLDVCASERRLTFRRARLPEFLQRVYLRNLRVGDAALDLTLSRHTGGVSIEVNRREGEVEIVAIK
jgi:glycogen debranching enzyme